MWCKNCNKEFAQGTDCPDCKETLIELPKSSWGSSFGEDLVSKWPRDDMGELIKPVYLLNRTNIDMADIMTINFLSAYGIPSLKLYPNDGRFGKLMIGMAGTGTDIYVPETMYEEALLLIRGDDNDELQR